MAKNDRDIRNAAFVLAVGQKLPDTSFELTVEDLYEDHETNRLVLRLQSKWESDIHDARLALERRGINDPFIFSCDRLDRNSLDVYIELRPVT